MTSVQLQFHGEASELIETAKGWANRYEFRLAAERFFPEYRPFELADIADAGNGLGSVDRLALGRRPFNLTPTRTHEFVARNPDCLFVSVEWPTSDGLRESAFDGGTTDMDLLRIWRRMLREAKSMMHKGAVIRNWYSSATYPVPSHLHTVGAHNLASQGIKMLAAAGSIAYLFDDVPIL
jgi:hypothetical protein